MQRSITTGSVRGAALLVAVFGLGSAAAQDTAGTRNLDATRATLDKWVETREILSRERRDWQVGRDVLEERIELLGAEIMALAARIDETRVAIGEADSERRELLAERGELDRAAADLAGTIGTLEAGLRSLLPRLPRPLAQRLEPLARRIPDDPASAGLTLGQRFQNVVGILNEVNKFQLDVTVANEVRDLGDGGSAEVQTLYVGLGQGYWVAPDGRAAGVGRPGPGGWVWTRADELADEVARAIAILRNEQVPAFVPLPVEIAGRAEGGSEP